jgi:hypothetical protein
MATCEWLLLHCLGNKACGMGAVVAARCSHGVPAAHTSFSRCMEDHLVDCFHINPGKCQKQAHHLMVASHCCSVQGGVAIRTLQITTCQFGEKPCPQGVTQIHGSVAGEGTSCWHGPMQGYGDPSCPLPCKLQYEVPCKREQGEKLYACSCQGMAHGSRQLT